MSGVLVAGLGGAGCAIASRIHNVTGCLTVAINTDRKALQSIDGKVFSEKLLIGPKLCGGFSASGMTTGRRAAEESWAELNALLVDSSQLVLVAGLGGGTGTGALPVIIQLAKAQELEILVAVTLPFCLETTRREVSLAALAELKATSVHVQVYDFDQADRNSPPLMIFEKADMEIAQNIVCWLERQPRNRADQLSYSIAP